MKKGLLDQIAYVRKIAVIGCLKIFYISPTQITQTDIIDKLYDMLRDRDPSVISNVVSVLNEILRNEGGMAINKSIVIHLLSKLKYLNEWSQSEILKLISKYTPEKEDIYDFLVIFFFSYFHRSNFLFSEYFGYKIKTCKSISCFFCN